MKSVFYIILMIWLSFMMLFCMMLFSEDVFIKHQAVHIRNKVNEIVEINNGYTTNAENEINNLISQLDQDIEIIVSKRGKLNFGEKLNYKVIIKYKRKLPFNINQQDVSFSIGGEFYNSNY